MKQRSILMAAGAAIAAAVASSASAGIIYQSTPALNGGSSFACSNCSGDGTRALDPFTLNSSANITGVNVVTLNELLDGQVQLNGQIPFTVNVYTSQFSSTPIFSQPVTTMLVGSGVDYDVVHANLAGLHLTGGKQYWISFDAFPLAIVTSPGNNNGAIVVDQFGNQLVQLNANLEYALYGSAIPEISTWTMLVFGVAMVGFSARRRMKRIAVAA